MAKKLRHKTWTDRQGASRNDVPTRRKGMCVSLCGSWTLIGCYDQVEPWVSGIHIP